MAEAKRKLAAVLSADVVGYSQLMHADEAATVKTLRQYREAIQHVVERHKGRIVNAPGDNILADFPSAVEAVHCAVEIQKVLEGRNLELAPERRMEFRIGINLGDVIEEEDGSIYGDGVNIAARMEALAEPGGICISSAIYDAIEGKLNFGFDFQGEHKVKNIDKPVHVYRVRTDSSAQPAPPQPAAGRSIRAGLITVAAVALVVAGIFVWQTTRPSAPPAPEQAAADDAALKLPDGPAIAVLPFRNMSGDPEQDYFSDGLTEDIITELARFPELHVLARNTTFQFKGQSVDIKDIGRKLGVRYVLEGSVRKSGSRVRITTQLIDAVDGGHIWAERFDRDLTDIFAVQDEITGRIVGAIAGGDSSVLERIERKLAKNKFPSDMKAYDYVLRGRAYRLFKKDEYFLAKGLFEQAIETDPDYARAYHELAWAALVGWWYRFEESDRAPSAIKASAIKAVELDDTDPRAHRTAAFGYFFDGQLDLFELEAQRAFDLSPFNAEIFAHLAMPIAFTGQWERGYKLSKKAYKLNPKSASGWYHTTSFYYHYLRGDYQKAIDILRQHPSQNIAETAMKFVPAYAQLGDIEKAREYWTKCVEIEPDWSVRRMLDIFRIWNFTEADTVKVMEGVYKAGIARP